MIKIWITLVATMLMASTHYAYSQDGWVTAKKIVEGPTEFIQGNRIKQCYYTVDGRSKFSITITEWICPQSVQYNLITKDWRSN